LIANQFTCSYHPTPTNNIVLKIHYETEVATADHSHIRQAYKGHAI
jgi:hypothetical protein